VDWIRAWLNGEPPANVWVGTSVEDQARADERIPALLSIPARVRFLSCEPLLGPVGVEQARKGLLGIDWVIAGGESGPGARPMHPDWARSLRDHGHAAGVAFFFKQWGEWAPQTQVPALALTEKSAANALYIHTDGTTCPASHGARAGRVTIQRVGKLAAGRILDGREWNEVPGGAS
jgi:protein gp37